MINVAYVYFETKIKSRNLIEISRVKISSDLKLHVNVMLKSGCRKYHEKYLALELSYTKQCKLVRK